MNDQEIVRRLRAARDAQLQVAEPPSAQLWADPDAAGHGRYASASSGRARRHGGAGRRMLAVAAAVAGIVAVSVVVATVPRHGASRPAAAPNGAQAGGAQAAGGSTPAAVRRSASCNVAPAGRPATRMPSVASAAAGGPAWNRPGPAFYATLSPDPAAFARQLRANAIAEEHFRTGPGGGFHVGTGTFSDANLSYLALNYLRGFLNDRAFPAALEPTAAAALARLAAVPGNAIIVVPDAQTAGGCHGTGYTARDHKHIALPAVVFDARGNYLGTATVR